MRQTRLKALEGTNDWNDRKHNIVSCYAEVVEHAVIGHLKPHFARDFSGWANFVIDGVARHQALSSKRKCEHLSCFGVDLRVSSERLTAQAAIEVPVALGLQSQRI